MCFKINLVIIFLIDIIKKFVVVLSNENVLVIFVVNVNLKYISFDVLFIRFLFFIRCIIFFGSEIFFESLLIVM